MSAVSPRGPGPGRSPIPISIDTYKSAVAERALDAGARIVNDISGMSFDAKMPEAVYRHGADVVIGHISGRPENMQDNPAYSDLKGEIMAFLRSAADSALSAGIGRDRIIIDPGIGFGKTIEQNYEIIDNIGYFKSAGYPVLIGLSRKSLIGKLYNEDADRLPATIALNAISALKGADIIRVHDVLAHRLALEAVCRLKRLN
jgi:dihydropteroate synthase